MSSLPLNLSVAATIEKSKLYSDDPWLALVKITWPDLSVLRLVRNPDDIVFDCGDGAGQQTWTRFYWEFGELNEVSDGSIPSWTVGVSNIGRMVESLIEQYGGGVGGSVSVYTVQASRLKREPDLELIFDITGSKSTAKLVNFVLGAESPFRIMFGRHLYSSNNCRHRYKSAQCTYSGPLPSCAFTLGGQNGCRAHFGAAVALPFGAFPGIDSNGLRVVQA